MKPRIKWANGCWLCEGYPGPSPYEAYKNYVMYGMPGL